MSFQEGNFSRHQLRQLLELALLLFLFSHMDFRLFMSSSHSRNQDKFTVSFLSRWKFIFYFWRELFEFWASVNSLNHLDCSHGAQAVCYTKFCISEIVFLSPPIKAMIGTCACAISLDHLDFWLFMFYSHILNQDEFTVNFILRLAFISLVFEEAVRILSLSEFFLSFGLQSWCTGIILFQLFLFQEAYFSPHQWRQLLKLALVLILLTIWILDSLSLAHLVEIRMNSLSVLFWDGSLSSYFF